MVSQVPSQISKLRPRLLFAARHVFPLRSRHSDLPNFRRKHLSHQPETSPIICITWRQYLSRSQQLPHTCRRHGGVLPLIIPDVQTFRPSGMPTLLFASTCRLFGVSKKVKSFAIKQIQPLFANHPGWVVAGGGSPLF